MLSLKVIDHSSFLYSTARSAGQIFYTAASFIFLSVCLIFFFINAVYAQQSAQLSAQQSVQDLPQTEALEKVTLQLKWFHQFQFAGYYAAKHKGFYKDAGLDVEIIERQGDFSTMNPATSDTIDFAITDSSIVVNYAKGEPLVILSAFFQHDPLVFISKKSSAITSPYEMAGKRIMFDNNGSNSASLRALLQMSNVSEDSYTHVAHSFNNDDLINDKVDVMSAYLSNQIFYFKQRDIELNIINPQHYGIDFYADLLITSEQELIQYPGRADSFRKASVKGWQYALQHPEEIIQIIKYRYRSRLSLDNLRFEAREIQKLMLPGQVPVGQVDVRRLHRVADVFSSLGISRELSDKDLNKLVYGVDTRLSLTAEEQDWLDQHPVIRVGIDRNFAPFEWLDENQKYLGMSADYIYMLEEILGVKFDIIKNKSWQQTLDMAKNNELDMLANANETLEREHYLYFTEPYIESPIIIINDGKNGFVGNLENLEGKTVAIETGYFMQDILARQYPQIYLIPTSNEVEALRLLDKGKAVAYIGDGISLNYIIQSTDLLNLRFSGHTEFHSKHRMAVTKENLLLRTILQKALDSISSVQRQLILNKWQGLHIEPGIKTNRIILYSIIVASLFLLFAYWLFRLNNEIRSRKKTEQALRQSEARFRQVFESIDSIAVQGYDSNHRMFYWNPASEKLYGYSTQQALGKKLEDLIIPDEMRETVENGINDWMKGGSKIPSSELTLKRSDGTPIHIFSNHVLLYNLKNEPELYCIDIDLTLRKQQEERIHHQAHYDSLTNLPNRFLVLDRLTQLLIEAKRKAGYVAVLFLDLDDFKKINDTLGHETGDKLLIQAAERLRNVLRSNDTVGRIGGDEFILLLSGLSNSIEIKPIVENLLNQFRRAFKIENRELILTASIGIAVYPDDGLNASTLLRNADSAMYNSKEQGRNSYSYFTDSMNHDVSRRMALEEQIQGALERQEFEVFYQSKIAIDSGKIIGAEALLRWHNPALGSISPAEFIPVAEQTGLIIPIGLFVLNEALKQTAVWQKTFDPDFLIAVNLSPRQFRDPKLVDSIEHALNLSSVSAESLELEITEGVLMSGHSYVDDVLTAINNLGITISMDNFGTGYSSLSYLRKYPFDILKIDRSFIRDIGIDERDRELISAVVAMAHGLNIKVIAEGVETEEQMAYLVKINCDISQGYFYNKPVSAADFVKQFKK